MNRFYEGMYRNWGIRYGTFAEYFRWHNFAEQQRIQKIIAQYRAQEAPHA